MLTKQEQEILDNAPEGATEYTSIHPTFGTGVLYGCNHGWEKLADLRKKQGKTVVDAVNEFKAEGSFLTSGYLIYIDERWSQASDGDWLKLKVCTIEEFNQCVKILSRIAGDGLFESYVSSEKTPLEPINPRTKVEYVKVTDSIFHLQPDLEAGELYLKEWENRDDYTLIDNEDTLMVAMTADSVYRKVETEIKTEKRWIVYNSKANVMALHGVHKTKEECYDLLQGNRYRDEFCYIEIEVEV